MVYHSDNAYVLCVSLIVDSLTIRFFYLNYLFWRCTTISDLMINEQIRDREIRLIGVNGEQLGIMSAREAMKKAEEAELDLVKIAPTAKPPVCKIIDYGKYRYELARKEKEAKKKQKVVEVKEIRMSPNIESNDLNTKMNATKKFLEKGNKVKITLRFRGREMAHMQSSRHILDDFLTSLLDQPPQNAHITHYRINDVLTLSPFSHNGFEIRDSQNMPSNAPCSLPLDTRPCEKCLADMRSNGRFKNYAFTTCTHCGARYTILNALPYDRIHTSMCDFPMCEECSSEYSNAFNRRFHAQPISCNMCAIRMRLIDKNGKIHTYKDARDDIKLIRQVAQAIEVGKILAIKGVGGFNLIANASNVETIATLRTRKNRPKKPFALMFKDLAQIESLSAISPLEREALLSPQAPIVLLRRHFQKGGILSEEALSLIAPDVSTLGAILPYNGIMHLLFRYIHTPLIFTSANLASLPIITDIDTLLETFCGANALIDMVLDYDREILHGADDSIMRLMAGDMRPLRLGRGYAPCNLSLP